ncbi:MAG: cupin domain-containing protein [Deltaproteobacteria bacterium]
MKLPNLFDAPAHSAAEAFDSLVESAGFRLERIVSSGQATPPGEWLAQERDEWVALLSGGAGIRFQGDEIVSVMRPGDFLNIPAQKRHRVEWTDSSQKTVWLALHYSK